MAYTLAGIRSRVLNDKLDDPNFNASTVDNFINDTQRSIFNSYELPFTEEVFNGSLPSGGHIYDFPDNFQVVQGLIVTSPDADRDDITANYMGFREFNESFPKPSVEDTGKPLFWTLHGNQLYLSRPTDQIYTLTLYYIKKSVTLDDDADVPEVPEEFEEILVLGAYYRCLARNEDFDQADYVKNGDYLDEVDKMLSRYGKKQQGKPTIMRQPLRRRR